ncbi:MAG TPA: DUF3667 domain-containing protein [Thermoanaerobaculia bacterium]|nr:DUF3667 domain-containing protein [Thermoanaerobaculia bacterium]
MTELPRAACTNCGNTLVDVFCARCGEKQPSHHDLTVGHFAHDLVHELIHLDSKLFRTLRELMLMPGQLTAEYFAGRKKRYIAPIRLFITLFAITFIAYSAFKPVAVYSLDVLMSTDPEHRLEKLLKTGAAKRDLKYEEVKTRIEHRWQKNMSLVSMLSIVSIAVVLKLLYFRRYFTEHLVWGTHYMCFSYVLSLLLWPLHFWTGVARNTSNLVLMAITSVVAWIYIYLALRRVYGQRGVIVFVKGLVVWAVTFGTSMFLMATSLLAAVFTVLRA